MQFFLAFFMIAAAFGFYQAFHWDFVTLVFSMAMLVPFAAVVTEHLLHPTTRRRFESDERLQIGFLLGVSALAFLVFSCGTTPFHRADNSVAQYAAIWWVAFPYSCGVLIGLDRVGDVFKSKAKEDAKRKVWRARRRKDDVHAEYRVIDDKVVEFDPKRFK